MAIYTYIINPVVQNGESTYMYGESIYSTYLTKMRIVLDSDVNFQATTFNMFYLSIWRFRYFGGEKTHFDPNIVPNF